MHSLLLTFLLGFIGLTCLAFALLYKQDGTAYPGMKWYNVLKQDLAVRGTFVVIGLGFLSWAGVLQFKF